MSRQRSIRIGDDLDRFIETQVGSAAYRTADEVVEAGLRLLRDETAGADEVAAWFLRQDVKPMTIEELREAIRIGEESGDPREVDFDKLLEEVEEELRAERAGRR